MKTTPTRIRLPHAANILKALPLLCLMLAALSLNAAKVPEELLGDWSLDLDTDEPAWLSIVEDGDQTLAHMRVYIGGVGPYKITEVHDGKAQFALGNRRKAKGSKVHVKRTVEVGINDGRLEGSLFRTPNDGSETQITHFTGTPIPPMPKTAPDLSNVHFGEKIYLFNGKDLSGWRPHETDKKNGWSVQDGMLVNTTPKTDFSPTGAYANLRTIAEFEDFKLHIEFLVEEKRNSGVYLRGMYEAQVVDRDSRMQGIQGVGAIFGQIPPSHNAGKPGGQWQSYDITLIDRHVTVVLNGETVIDNQPVIGPTSGAIYTNPAAPGPLYLQGDHTNVKYRNIIYQPVVSRDPAYEPVRHLFGARLLLRKLQFVGLTEAQRKTFDAMSQEYREQADQMRASVGIDGDMIKLRDKIYSKLKNSELKGDALWDELQRRAKLTDGQRDVFSKMPGMTAQFKKDALALLNAEQLKNLPKGKFKVPQK